MPRPALGYTSVCDHGPTGRAPPGGTLPPHLCAVRHLRKVPQAKAVDVVKPAGVAPKGFVTSYPACPQGAGLAYQLSHLPAQRRLGLEGGLRGNPAASPVLGIGLALHPPLWQVEATIQQDEALTTGIPQVRPPLDSFARFPTASQYCRFTPTDSQPCFRKSLPSKARTPSSPKYSSTSCQ